MLNLQENGVLTVLIILAINVSDILLALLMLVAVMEVGASSPAFSTTAVSAL
jgi:hypothetical protein